MSDDPAKTMLMFGKREATKREAEVDVGETLREPAPAPPPAAPQAPPQAPPQPERYAETDAGIEEEAPPPPPSETLVAGTRVGDYIVTSLLDIGGMGAVYAGEHPKIGKRVAIKVLHSSVANDPLVSGRFLQEARAVNRIQHPNIVDIFAFGELDDGRPFFVMDLLEGACLRDRLLAATPISADEAFRLFIQVCSALGAAHAAGIVHRDLKPENIFVTRDVNGQPAAKLLDFGVAKVLQPEGEQPILRTRAGFRVGTPRYMAPEQLKGKAVDGRADIYALGLVMYEVFTGTWPWEAKTEYDYIHGHLKLKPLPCDELDRRCRPLAELLERCLAKDAPSRPQTAEELAEALRRAQKSWPVSFSHVSQPGIITALNQARRMQVAPSTGQQSGVVGTTTTTSRSRSGGLYFLIAGVAIGLGVIAALTFLR